LKKHDIIINFMNEEDELYLYDVTNIEMDGPFVRFEDEKGRLDFYNKDVIFSILTKATTEDPYLDGPI
jgi:hypothetical protein